RARGGGGAAGLGVWEWGRPPGGAAARDRRDDPPLPLPPLSGQEADFELVPETPESSPPRRDAWEASERPAEEVFDDWAPSGGEGGADRPPRRPPPDDDDDRREGRSARDDDDYEEDDRDRGRGPAWDDLSRPRPRRRRRRRSPGGYALEKGTGGTAIGALICAILSCVLFCAQPVGFVLGLIGYLLANNGLN